MPLIQEHLLNRMVIGNAMLIVWWECFWLEYRVLVEQMIIWAFPFPQDRQTIWSKLFIKIRVQGLNVRTAVERISLYQRTTTRNYQVNNGFCVVWYYCLTCVRNKTDDQFVLQFKYNNRAFSFNITCLRSLIRF